MRYLRHEYILLVATLAAALAWFSFSSFPWVIDAACCAFFTMAVFGYALRKRGRKLFSGDDARSMTEIIFAHTVCLTAMVMVLRTGMFASSSIRSPPAALASNLRGRTRRASVMSRSAICGTDWTRRGS